MTAPQYTHSPWVGPELGETSSIIVSTNKSAESSDRSDLMLPIRLPRRDLASTSSCYALCPAAAQLCLALRGAVAPLVSCRDGAPRRPQPGGHDRPTWSRRRGAGPAALSHGLLCMTRRGRSPSGGRGHTYVCRADIVMNQLSEYNRQHNGEQETKKIQCASK